MTFRRASEIQHGVGAPPTAAEREELKRLVAKFAPALKRMGPEVAASVKAYPKAVKVIRAAPKAERARLERLPVVAVALMGAGRPAHSGRREGAPRSRASRSSQRSRSPGRSSSGSDDPGEHDDVDDHPRCERCGSRVMWLGGRPTCVPCWAWATLALEEWTRRRRAA